MAAATEGGWRWWTPGVADVQSDWCSDVVPGDPDVPGDRPIGKEAGWVRVVVSGEVYGPLAALWPDRLDRVYSVATGPAILVPPEGPDQDRPPLVVPTDLLTRLPAQVRVQSHRTLGWHIVVRLISVVVVRWCPAWGYVADIAEGGRDSVAVILERLVDAVIVPSGYHTSVIR